MLNVASAGGFQPMPFMAAYGATKAFVISFTEALAAERPQGVRFAALCPGPVETEFGLVAGTGGRFSRMPGVITAEAAAQAALDLIRRRARPLRPGPVQQARGLRRALLATRGGALGSRRGSCARGEGTK